jgi:hypothetical protein
VRPQRRASRAPKEVLTDTSWVSCGTWPPSRIGRGIIVPDGDAPKDEGGLTLKQIQTTAVAEPAP